ncbi:MAG: hypothetical protein EPN86_00275 [Nanoarchaeota archaeon]|nr:MAG: hypothetical protein EPN86_00275 [Nanoarchaeota archaeon]
MEIEDLLRFLDRRTAEDIAQKIRGRDPSIMEKVIQISAEAYDYYEKRGESEGPQEYAHRGLLYEHIGDYLAGIASIDERTLDLYHAAWNSYMLARGHDIDAKALVEKVPQLMKYDDVQATKYE